VNTPGRRALERDGAVAFKTIESPVLVLSERILLLLAGHPLPPILQPCSQTMRASPDGPDLVVDLDR
jgi:hypothetical protein